MKSLESFILGFVYFEDDTISTITLTPQQESEIQNQFLRCLSQGANSTDVALAWEKKNVKSRDDAYYKVSLSSQDKILFRNFLGDELTEIIQEIQFGYYHHRAIFKVIYKAEASLAAIRNRRSKIHKLIRDRCFDMFTNKTIENVKIRYIYSYTLFIIPEGQKIFNEEIRALKEIKYDPMFSTRTTAFGFHIAENRLLSSILGTSHYIRISVPGTIVYLKGKELDHNLLSYIIDGIYYGGLHGKLMKDRDQENNTQTFSPNNIWSHSLMIETYKILQDTVSVKALSYVSNTINRLSLMTGILALIVAFFSLVPLVKNSKVIPASIRESQNVFINSR